jgi:hypothetical protein
MVGILHLRGKLIIPRSPALVYTSACQELAVDVCCFAAEYGIRPWTPWIWGILNFRSIRVEIQVLVPPGKIPFIFFARCLIVGVSFPGVLVFNAQQLVGMR